MRYRRRQPSTLDILLQDSWPLLRRSALVVLAIVFVLFVLAAITPSADAKPPPLIFADSFEAGLGPWSRTEPDSGILWHSTDPTPGLECCDTPSGDYLLRLGLSNPHGATERRHVVTVYTRPCSGDPLKTCRVYEIDRYIFADDLETGGTARWTRKEPPTP